MERTFFLTDQAISGNVVAYRLRSTLGRGCRYSPNHPWTNGEGVLVDDETGHAFALFRKQEGRNVIVLHDGRDDFLGSIMAIASQMPIM